MLRFFLNGGQIPDDARQELWVLRAGRTEKGYISAVWQLRAQESYTQRKVKSRGNWPFSRLNHVDVVIPLKKSKNK